MTVGLPVGTMLGEYRIEELIGRGGMGVVYRALEVKLDRSVAIKVLAPELAHDPSYRERFKREARHAAGLEHPNVVPVHATGEVPDEGTTFLVMRYVPGTDLRALIRDEGRLDPTHAASIVAQVAAALDAAHRRGLVHRDVKPANILITRAEAEHVYLTDFGLTKALSTDAVMTRTGTWMGTVDYISPEQLRGGEVDGRADVYSLGCVLYETLTGEIPYPRDTEAAKMWAHVADPPPSLRAVAPDLSEELDAVVRRAAAKEPDDRFQTAGELAVAALRAAQAYEGVAPQEAEGERRSAKTVLRETPSEPQPAPSAPPSAPPVPPEPIEAIVEPFEPATLAREPVEEPVEAPVEPIELAAPTAAAPPTVPPSTPPRAPASRDRQKTPLAAARRPPIRLLVAGVGAVAVVILAVVLLAGGGDEKAGTGDVLPAIKVGARPLDAVAVGDSVWVVNEGDGTLSRVPTASAKPTGEALRILEAPYRVAGDKASLWAISGSAPQAAGIDPTASAPKVRTAALQRDPYDVAVGEGAVWIVANLSGPTSSGRLIALDPATGDRRSDVTIGSALTGVATGHGAVWVLDGDGGVLHRITPSDLADQAQITVGTGASAVVTDGSAVWVASGARLLRIDPGSNRIVKRIPLAAAGEAALAAGSGSVWWIDQDGGTVTRVDPGENKAAGSPIRIGPDAGGAAVTPGTLWVTSPTEGSLIRVRF